MRILRLADVSVIVHIRDHDKVTVVVPSDLACDEALSMARLVLTPEEHSELAEAIEQVPRTVPAARDLPVGRPCQPDP